MMFDVALIMQSLSNTEWGLLDRSGPNRDPPNGKAAAGCVPLLAHFHTR